MSKFEEGDEPSLSGSSFGDVSVDEPSVSEPSLSESSIIMEAPEKKDDGIEVPPTPKFNVYTGMLLVAFLATGLASFMMYREFGTYDYVKEAVDAKPLTQDQVAIPELPPIAPPPTGTPRAAAPAAPGMGS